jgi:hypothetical protein
MQMKLNTAPRTSDPENTPRLPIRDVGSLTFDQLDEAFQRGGIDAATLVRLQCFDRGAVERVESRLPGYWDPERAASALLAAVTASSGPVSLDAIARPAPKRVSARREVPGDESTFAKATVLVILCVASAVAAVSIAVATPSGQHAGASDERAMV